MLTLKTQFEKNKFSKNNKETLLLLEMIGRENHEKKEIKNTKLNISIAIDISGSMSTAISMNDGLNRHVNNRLPNFNLNQPPASIVTLGQNPLFPNINDVFKPNTINQETNFIRPISKLEQAKKAAIQAIDVMKNGDYLSIVAFESNIHMVCEAVELTNENRDFIKSKINSLRHLGSTDLYNGWYTSATEVAKNIGEHSINRIIVITDGQANLGITDSSTISSHVGKAYTAKISTTTFGIGEGFNEDLLQSMATSGCGNFYYVSDDNKLEEMFKSEFNGLSNLSALEVSVKLDLMKGVTLLEQMNNFEKVGEKYNLNNINVGKTLPLLFKLSTKIPKNKKEMVIGKITISYKDINGIQHDEIVDLKGDVVSHSDWEKLDFNKEVKVQETLMIIANNKMTVAKAFGSGDLEGARGMLRASASYMNGLNIQDERLSAQTASINKNIVDSETKSLNALKKDVTYESYQSRYNK